MINRKGIIDEFLGFISLSLIILILIGAFVIFSFSLSVKKSFNNEESFEIDKADKGILTEKFSYVLDGQGKEILVSDALIELSFFRDKINYGTEELFEQLVSGARENECIVIYSGPKEKQNYRVNSVIIYIDNREGMKGKSNYKGQVFNLEKYENAGLMSSYLVKLKDGEEINLKSYRGTCLE